MASGVATHLVVLLLVPALHLAASEDPLWAPFRWQMARYIWHPKHVLHTKCIDTQTISAEHVDMNQGEVPLLFSQWCRSYPHTGLRTRPVAQTQVLQT